jgi:hypothetical protein
VNNTALRWPMHATTAQAHSQRASCVIAAMHFVTTTFVMHAMVGRQSRQLKMPRRDVHGRPRFAKLSIDDGSKVKIAPVHSDFRCGFLAAVPDGICWLAPRSLTRTLGASSGTGFANHGLTCFAITS